MIKKALLAIVLLLVVPLALLLYMVWRAVPVDSTEIYAAYIEAKLPEREIKYGPPHPIFVVNRTSKRGWSTLPEWWNVRRRIPALSRIAFVSMVAHGSVAHPLNWPQNRAQAVDDREGVTAISRQYPYGFHYFQFSPVGFDATGTEAVFHVAYICSEKCGDGNYVQMRKRDGVWVVVRRANTWVL